MVWLAEAQATLAAAYALPGMRDDLTEEQRADPAVRAPSSTERADGMCLYALALHRAAAGSSPEAHEVCAPYPTSSIMPPRPSNLL